jgi:hypothetical protein
MSDMSKQIEYQYDVFVSYTNANWECVEGCLMVKDFPGVSQIRALLEPSPGTLQRGLLNQP